jgi:transcription elongation factor Elf1
MKTQPQPTSNVHVIRATCPACGHTCDQHVTHQGGQTWLVCDHCGHTRAAGGGK